MTKHTAMILLGIAVAILPVLGFPAFFRDFLFIVFGLAIASLSYLSSVLYCANCRKLIDEAEQALPTSEILPPTA